MVVTSARSVDERYRTYSVQDAARMLGVCRQTVYRALLRGTLEGRSLDGPVRVTGRSLLAFMEGSGDDRGGEGGGDETTAGAGTLAVVGRHGCADKGTITKGIVAGMADGRNVASSPGALWVLGEDVTGKNGAWREYFNLGPGPLRVRVSSDNEGGSVSAAILAPDGHTVVVASGASASAIAATLDRLTTQD